MLNKSGPFPRCRLVYAALVLLAPATSVAGSRPDWSAYVKVLDGYVQPATLDNGTRLNVVDYAGLRTEPAFNAAVETLERYPVSSLESRRQQLSFYINAYNIFAIKTVLDHWPVDSIRDAGSWFRPVWKREAGWIGGRPITLHQIEHDILRELDEPRIHFAIVCASVSCPDLAREPYRPGQLDRQLDTATRRFLSNPVKGLRIDEGEVRVSKIFDWFEEDFDNAGGVRSFIDRYVELQEDTPVSADLPYDWRVNVKSPVADGAAE